MASADSSGFITPVRENAGAALPPAPIFQRPLPSPGVVPAPPQHVVARKVSIVTANAPFAERLRGAFVGSREIALKVEQLPQRVASVHRLACDCAADALVVDGNLFAAGRILPGDEVASLAKNFHLLLAFPAVSQASVDVALRARAHGCIGFDIPAPQLVRAIAAVAKGDLWFPRWMMRSFFERAAASAGVEADAGNGTTPCDAGAAMTAREVEVMHFVRKGLTNKEIGRELCISPNTVKKHVQGALRKLGLSHRRQLF